MYTSIKNTKQRAKAVRLLIALAAVGATGQFLSEKDVNILKNEPSFVEVNEAVKDAAGNIAIRITPAGSAAVAAQQSAPAAPAAEVAKQEFKIETGIPVPATLRGGSRGETYPFAKLEVGTSFFVAATAAKPNPAKSLGSTVSSATRRYKTETPARKFIIRPVDGGARIWRTV